MEAAHLPTHIPSQGLAKVRIAFTHIARFLDGTVQVVLNR